MDCRPRCRSKQHALQLIVAATKGSTSQLKLYLPTCHNLGHARDASGRSVLHVAASCGKWRTVEWLLAERGAELASKDVESGWTALHRALFYGQLNTARRLIAVSARLRSPLVG